MGNLKSCAFLTLLLTAGMAQAQNNKPLPQLGKSPVKEVINAMTLEEKDHKVLVPQTSIKEYKPL